MRQEELGASAHQCPVPPNATAASKARWTVKVEQRALYYHSSRSTPPPFNFVQRASRQRARTRAVAGRQALCLRARTLREHKQGCCADQTVRGVSSLEAHNGRAGPSRAARVLSKARIGARGLYEFRRPAGRGADEGCCAPLLLPLTAPVPPAPHRLQQQRQCRVMVLVQVLALVASLGLTEPKHVASFAATSRRCLAVCRLAPLRLRVRSRPAATAREEQAAARHALQALIAAWPGMFRRLRVRCRMMLSVLCVTHTGR